MKRLTIWLLVMIFTLGIFSAAFAEEIVPDTPAASFASASASASSAPGLTASGITSAVKKAVNNGMASISKKIEAVKADVLRKDTATSSSVNALKQEIDGLTGKDGAITKIGEDVKTGNKKLDNLDSKLTGKNGEFEKTRAAVGAVDASLFWVAIAIILAVLVVGIGIVFFLKRSIKKVGQKVDNVGTKVDAVPQKVNEFFDCSPLEVIVGGHKLILHQDDDVLARRAYQILLVEDDVDPAITPAAYVLQEVSNREKAIDSFKRTMREHFNGKIALRAAAGNTAATLTQGLIAYHNGSGKLEIIPL